MRQIKRPAFGERILCTRWGDRDPRDPWYIGHLIEIRESSDKAWYMLEEDLNWWQCAHRGTQMELDNWLDKYRTF